MYVYVKDAFIATQDAHISISERGFRFGDGVFETIPVYFGIPYQWEFHLERLQEGLRCLKISFDVTGLLDIGQELIKKNKLTDGFIRIYISRGIGGKGYLPEAVYRQKDFAPSSCGLTAGSSHIQGDACVMDPAVKPQDDDLAGDKRTQNPATLVVETIERTPSPESPVSLWQSSYERISPRALPSHIKHAQGVNSTLARMEAVENGCFDALQLNHEGYIAETSSANIFWLKDGSLYTPSLAAGVLSGSTRHAILRLSSYKIMEGEYRPDALQTAESVVIANANWRVLGVSLFSPLGWKWDSAVLAQELNRLLWEDICTQCRK